MKTVRQKVSSGYHYVDLYRFTSAEVEEALLLYLENDRGKHPDRGKSRRVLGLRDSTKAQRKQPYYIHHPLTLVIDQED